MSKNSANSLADSSAKKGLSPAWFAVALLAAVIALVTAFIYGGAAAGGSLLDPGVLVRWGLPSFTLINNLAAATVIASLVFATIILPGKMSAVEQSTTADSAVMRRTLNIAASAGVVWTLGAVGCLIFNYANSSGQGLSADPQFTQGLFFFATQLSFGQAWLVIAIIAAVTSTLSFGLRSRTGLAITLVLAVIGLVPQALIGHSASSPDHGAAVNSLFLHLLGVALWAGGIIVLALLSPQLAKTSGQSLSQVLHRFSALALVAYALVILSGVVNAAVRLTRWEDVFGSPYGQLILVKVGATALLGAIGFAHRQWLIPQAAEPKGRTGVLGTLWRLIGVELVLMAATSAVAVALSSSPPPVDLEYGPEATPAEILSTYALPPELTPERWFTEWRINWLWLVFAVFSTVAYVSAVVKLRRRGDSWPWVRTVCWVLGMVALVYITSGGPNVYGLVLFSAHMVHHMGLTMVAPIFMVLATPVTLALRTLPPRRDGSRGLREWIMVVTQSKFAAIITNPVVAAVNFVVSVLVFYYTPIFGFSLREHVGHELMNIHFLITGYLFALSMIGRDPVPKRFSYPMRLVVLLATMTFHAFWGVALMSSNALLEASYFGNLGRTWGASAIADQQVGGAIAWGIGEVPTLLLAIGVAVMWSRDDARETKRKDRAADRNNDADLVAYNAMFASLAEQDERQEKNSVPVDEQ